MHPNTPLEVREKDFVDRFNYKYGSKFVYLGGYTHSNNFFSMQCRKCGAVIERKAQIIRRKGDCIICKTCAENAREGRKPSVYTKKCKHCGNRFTTTTSRQLFCTPECKYQNHLKQQKIRNREKFVPELKNCKYCGIEFATEINKSGYYCSERCAGRHHKEIRRHRKRTNGDFDNSITLPKLIKRDNGICAICGQFVDVSDQTLVNGYIVSGDRYPSIDHIEPLSRGGSHTWDNVQLAHRICNSIKCDQ